MKKLIALVIIGLGLLAFQYGEYMADHFVDFLLLVFYALIAFALLIIGIYIKDRIAYHKFKKDMWKEVRSEY